MIKRIFRLIFSFAGLACAIYIASRFFAAEENPFGSESSVWKATGAIGAVLTAIIEQIRVFRKKDGAPVRLAYVYGTSAIPFLWMAGICFQAREWELLIIPLVLGCIDGIWFLSNSVRSLKLLRHHHC